MFRAISLVAVDCSSMAAAIEATMALTSRMICETLPISVIPPAVADCTPAMRRLDVFGGGGGLLRQCFDFRGDHGESFAGRSGARRFDGRVERQQVGLRGNFGDGFGDFADFAGGHAELIDLLRDARGLAGGLIRDAARFFGILRDLADGGSHLLGGGGDMGQVRGASVPFPRRRR